MIAFTEFTLENGLQVIVHEDPTVQIAVMNILYDVGSRDEHPDKTGFAHLFEHLMFEGSRNVRKGQFDELLESVGGANNGSTSPDRTNYWETVPSNALELPLFLAATEILFQGDDLFQRGGMVKHQEIVGTLVRGVEVNGL